MAYQPTKISVPHPPAPLAQLDAAARHAAREMLAEAEAANTRRSYQTAAGYWGAWFRLRYGCDLTLPMAPAHVVQFVLDHRERVSTGADGELRLAHELPPDVDAALVRDGFKKRPGPLSIATVRHRLAVLSKAHRERAAQLATPAEPDPVPNPCASQAVKLVLAAAVKAAAKRGERPRKKEALTRDKLEVLLATCDDSLLGIRDRALLLFAFASGGRRRSEVVDADLADLQRVGPRAFLYYLGFGKTMQAGATVEDHPDKPIKGKAADALAHWLAVSGLKSGRIFRRVRGSKVGGPLTPEAVALLVQRRAALAGIEGDFAGHSLRAGFATEAGRQGVPLKQVQAMTGHRSLAVLLGYMQAGEALQNPAAALLDDNDERSVGIN